MKNALITSLLLCLSTSLLSQDVYLNNTEYIRLKNSSNQTTRSLGINSYNHLYFGSVDAPINNMFFNNNGVNLMTITSSGLVGIGTTSPGRELHITNSTGAQIKLESTASGNWSGLEWSANSGNYNAYSGILDSDGRYFIDVASNGEDLTVLQNGNIGIGTTSPNSLLHLDSDNNTDLTIEAGPNLNSTLKLVEQGTGDVGTYLKYDGNSNRFGIFVGNNSPLERLSILRDNGNVGIGTTSPASRFHIKKGDSNGSFDAYTTAAIEDADARLQLLSSNGGSNGSALIITNENKHWSFHQKTSAQNNRLDIGYLLANSGDIPANQSISMSFSTGGNIGIGTTSPTDKLSVNGTIRSKKVKVDANGWPDYVFAPNYELRSLSEVEKYIKVNQHLPEVPAAKEIETNGLDLGAMDATLLKKVEELTLYLIQESKEKDDLKKENKELKETLKDILKRLEKLEKK